MKKNVSLSTTILACVLTLVLTTTVFVVASIFTQRQSVVSNLKFAAFSNSGFERVEVALDANTLRDYTSSFDEYNSHIYYNKLNESEKAIYHIFEYALDHSYCDIYIDNTLLNKCNYSAKQILSLYSLDSPIVEQNSRFTDTKGFSTTVKFTVSDLPLETKVNGYYYHIPNFSEAKLSKKKSAIEKAKEVYSNIPTDADFDKAKAIFEYLVDHVTYSTEKSFDESDYLYDALCEEATNCDGFANAFSLLSNLCGLDCFEKDFIPENGDAGHTWNCVRIDNIWYNVDVSKASDARFGDEKISEIDEYLKAPAYYLSFCFSDSKQSNTARFSELVPSCANDMYKADIEIFCAYESVDIVPTIISTLQKSGKSYILVATDFALSESDMNRLANAIGSFNNRYILSNGHNIYGIRPKS